MSEETMKDPSDLFYECPGCEQLFRKTNPCGDCPESEHLTELKHATYRELKEQAHENVQTEWGRGLLKIVNAALDHDPKKTITTAEFSLRLWDAFEAGVDYGKRIKN